MSSDSKTRYRLLEDPSVLIVMPTEDGRILHRSADESVWSGVEWSGFMSMVRRRNPSRVIINPYWRSRLKTTYKIINNLRDMRVQLCPSGDLFSVVDSAPSQGGPIDVTLRIRTCIRAAIDMASSPYKVDYGWVFSFENHPLRPVFQMKIFMHPLCLAKAFLWVIDPRLFIDPLSPDKGWKSRIYRAFGVSSTFARFRKGKSNNLSDRMLHVHHAWSGSSPYTIPHGPCNENTAGGWIYDKYIEIRKNITDKSSSPGLLNQYAAMLTARKIINFVCECWLHCANAGNYEIVRPYDYFTDPDLAKIFSGIVREYCLTLDGRYRPE